MLAVDFGSIKRWKGTEAELCIGDTEMFFVQELRKICPDLKIHIGYERFPIALIRVLQIRPPSW